jgi:hypothetical protein
MAMVRGAPPDVIGRERGALGHSVLIPTRI